MGLHRRSLLRVGAIVSIAAAAGCIENDIDSDPAIVDVQTRPFAFTIAVRQWFRDRGGFGNVVISGGVEQTETLFDLYNVLDEEQVRSFLKTVDYANERVIIIESVGPTLCYREVEVENVHVEQQTIHADASAVDTSEPGEVCPQVIAFPSAIVRVTFESAPLDGVAVTITDGWGDTDTVSAHIDDWG